MNIDDLPYRPCVGVMVINAEKKVWVGRRIFKKNDPTIQENWWQMPQGGIDEGEDAAAAACRELYEETSIQSVELIDQIDEWLTYDLPRDKVGIALKGKYRGQKQKWFAFRFIGAESEVNVLNPADGTHKAEFDQWKWVNSGSLTDLIVPFKRDVYTEVVRRFQTHID